jgi:hypothetical protein
MVALHPAAGQQEEKEEGGRMKEEGGRRKEEGGRRKMDGVIRRSWSR